MADANLSTREREVKHTPAPWHADGESIWAKDQAHVDGVAKVFIVPDRQEYGLRAQSVADAHLIAAAPEMYEVLASMKEHGMQPAKIEAVLAKARGES